MSTLETAPVAETQKRARISESTQAHCLAIVGALFILAVAAGSVWWGIWFAFCFALVLAPVMLVVVCMLARANSLND